MDDLMLKRVKALYVTPFELCSHGIYIYDANMEMVADFKPHNDNQFRPRGYGRISYLDDGELLSDACEDYLTEVVKGYSSDKNKCVELLNTAWNEKVEPISVTCETISKNLNLYKVTPAGSDKFLSPQALARLGKKRLSHE